MWCAFKKLCTIKSKYILTFNRTNIYQKNAYLYIGKDNKIRAHEISKVFWSSNDDEII